MTAPRRLDDVKGWFPSLDQVLFEWFLTRQERLGEQGDLLEMGAYLGKSAIFIGGFQRVGERFTVCDLFDGEAPDEHNAAEARKSYASLTRVAFERNYLAFRDELPDVVQAPTSALQGHVDPGSCRFIHIDASHLYEHVAGDIETARKTLAPGGVVVLDDFRSEHTPGVAAATWEAVFNGGLRPICLSTQKFYGTWADPEPLQDELLAEMQRRSDVRESTQDIAGQRVLRFSGKPKPSSVPVSRFASEPLPDAAPHTSGTTVDTGSSPHTFSALSARRVRRIAADVLPPVLTRALRRRRR